MRAVEYIGKAEGIRSWEMRVTDRIDQLDQSIDRLSARKEEVLLTIQFIRERIRQLSQEEEGENLIFQLEYELRVQEDELRYTGQELAETQSQKKLVQQELRDVVEERQATLFEIQEAARVHTRDISGASNLFGTFAQIGSNLSKTFQGALGALSQAASILGGTVDSREGTGNRGGGSGSTAGVAPDTSRGIVAGGNPYASRQISGAHTLSGRFSSPPLKSLSTFSSSQLSSQGISAQSVRSSSGKSETSFISAQTSHSTQTSNNSENISGALKQGKSYNFSTKQASVAPQIKTIHLNKQQRPSFYDSDIGWKMDILREEFPHMKSSEVRKIVRSQKHLANIKRATIMKPTKGLSKKSLAHRQRQESGYFSRLIKTKAKGYVQEEMLRHILRDYFDSVSVTPKQSTINGRFPDIIAKGAKCDIHIGSLVIHKGENLSIESKAGEASYLKKEIRGHIAAQLAGMPQSSHRMLVVTSDYRNLSKEDKELLNQTLSDNQATMDIMPYYAYDLTNAIIHTDFVGIRRRSISRPRTKNFRMVSKHRTRTDYKIVSSRPLGWFPKASSNNQEGRSYNLNAEDATGGKGENKK